MVKYVAGQMESDQQEMTTNPLRGKTAKQAATWIENNVNDLATAKTALKYMAATVVYLQKQIDDLQNV
jgi:hypothetical protein